MFHVKHKCYHKKPIYGQKIVLPRFSFVKNFFQKSLWSICRPSSKKKRLPEGSLAELMKIVLCSGRLCCGWWLTLRVSRPFAFALSRAHGHFWRWRSSLEPSKASRAGRESVGLRDCGRSFKTPLVCSSQLTKSLYTCYGIERNSYFEKVFRKKFLRSMQYLTIL